MTSGGGNFSGRMKSYYKIDSPMNDLCNFFILGWSSHNVICYVDELADMMIM